MLRGAAFALSVLLAGAASAAPAPDGAACPGQVRVSLPNFEIAPYVLGTEQVESPPGLLIAWTRAALRAAGCKSAITVKRRPPNRQLAEVELGLLDILPGFAYSANPDDQLVFPLFEGAVDERRAVMIDSVSLYVRRPPQGAAPATPVQFDGATLSGTRGVVGTSTGGASTDEVAAKFGWTMEAAPTPRADLDKLLAGRVDVILESDLVLGPYLTGAAGAQVVKLSPPVRTTLRYAAVRKGFAAQYPAFTERFWHALCVEARRGGAAVPACR